MAKKNLKAKESPGIVFPDLAPKVDLECQTILEDQILVIEVII
jgi:hypothetical protein